jgi:beta-lactam-binding protein with PASTA domain/predicted Ser/Thr protein kinase
MSVSDTLIDTLFDGRYRIVRRLGAGGMANVYLAEDQELGRRVAIKILNDRHANDDQFVERFRREAKNAASLSHPNIVSIYDRGEAEGTYYIAMEHLDGRTLKELIVARGPAPPKVAIEYVRQILAALRFAHRKGIVHRDIKPHNVLVDAEGRVKVTDFGIARAGASQMTEAGSIVGTAQYLSPEQARGDTVDQRSDLYSLGVVLYELLTGTVPFTGDSPVEIAMKHLSAPVEPPSKRRADVPKELDLVVTRALAKDPDERYQTAEEMEAELAAVADGAGVSSRTAEAATAIISGAAATAATTITRPVTPTRRPGGPYPPTPPEVLYDYEEPPPRRPIWPWVLTLMLLVLAGGGAIYAYDQIQDRLSANEPVAVPLVEGQRRLIAQERIREQGLQPRTRYEFNDDVPVGLVISQDPNAGDKIERGNVVRLVVSLGHEKVVVPDVRGKDEAQAIAELTEAGLRANPVQVNSNEEIDTVTAQEPRPGEKVTKSTRVRINVSTGPKPIAVPSVVGQPVESATSTLQAGDFSVARNDVDSNQPAGIVIAQNPEGGAAVARGSRITLTVSKGPKTKAVPSVDGLDRALAQQTLKQSGFKVKIVEEPVDDASFDGIVLSQDPAADSQAKPGATVTIVVGTFQETEEPPPTTTTP